MIKRFTVIIAKKERHQAKYHELIYQDIYAKQSKRIKEKPQFTKLTGT